VTARLVNADDGFMLWSDVREHALTDVFTVQDEIARALAEALGTELAEESGAAGGADPAAAALARERGTTNAAAYDAYLRGRHFLGKRGDGSLREAVRYFEAAIAADPGYALAHAGQADAYALLASYGRAPRGETVAQALRAADRAVALDSTRAEVWTSRGAALRAAWQWPRAERAFRRAIVLDPGHAEAHQWLGEVLLLDGRLEEGTAELRRAVELEPLSPTGAASFAHALALGGRQGEAMSRARAALALDSTLAPSHRVLGTLQLYAGQHREALRSLRSALDLDSTDVRAAGLLGYAQASMGDREGAAATLRALSARADAHGHAGAIALVQLGLGDLPEALTWMERAAERRDEMYADGSLAVPLFDAVRGTPRFAALVGRLGLSARLAAPR
jgi:Flp pilus assembly protein TadD